MLGLAESGLTHLFALQSTYVAEPPDPRRPT
jgi:hypothetical protein